MQLCGKALHGLSEHSPRIIPPKTKEISAGIAHFGVGAFHRSHQALYTQLAMEEKGEKCWGIIGVGIMPFDLKMNKVLKNQDYLYSLVQKSPKGEPVYRVVNSIVDHIYAAEDTTEMVDKVGSSNIKVLTLTITEGGYYMVKDTGQLDIMNPSIQHDANHWRKEHPKSIFGFLARIMERRMKSHGTGITILSCDNIQHNGRVIQRTFLSFLVKAGDQQLLMWVKEKCSFPNSMVDRITPQTPPTLAQQILKQTGIKDQWPVVAEDFIQWVIEDKFVCGRPAWQLAGAQFVPDVSPYEKMKLRILNASHQALCYLGSLDGLSYVHQAASLEIMQKFMKKYLAEEVRQTLDPVPGIDLLKYEDKVIQRFSNPNVKDTLSRICEFTSDRIPIFNGPAMLAMTQQKKIIPCSSLIVASWIAYAHGQDEKGKPLPLVDNRAEEVKEAAKMVKTSGNVEPFLKIKGMLGDLGNDKEFCSSVGKAYHNIRNNGAMNAIKMIL